MNFGFGKLRRGTARGGLTCLAQARQNRPGIGELDLTELFIYWAQRVAPVRITDDSSKRSGYRDHPCSQRAETPISPHRMKRPRER